IHARYQFGLRHDAGAAVGQFLLHPLEDLDVPAAAAQHDRRQKTAHRAADHDRAALSGHRKFLQFLKLSPAGKVFYIAYKVWRNARALSRMDKSPDRAEKAAWPPAIAAEFERERQNNNGCVGTTLLSESDRVRVWIIRLAPGERIGFHRHVLD